MAVKDRRDAARHRGGDALDDRAELGAEPEPQRSAGRGQEVVNAEHAGDGHHVHVPGVGGLRRAAAHGRREGGRGVAQLRPARLGWFIVLKSEKE